MLRKIIDMLRDIPGTVIAAISFVITAAGILIVNLHLGTYFVSDYTIINAKAIHTGLVFFFVVSITTIVIFAFFETRDYQNNSSFQIFFNFVTKPIHITNFFIMFYVYTSNTPDDSKVISVFSTYALNTYWLYPLLMGSVFGWMWKLIDFSRKKQQSGLENEKIVLPRNLLQALQGEPLLILGLLPFPLLFFCDDTYKNLFIFFGTISFWCFSYVKLCIEKAIQTSKMSGF